MLLCEKCLGKYKISCSLGACIMSYGNCKGCNLIKLCYDIPHEFYEKKLIVFNPSRR